MNSAPSGYGATSYNHEGGCDEIRTEQDEEDETEYFDDLEAEERALMFKRLSSPMLSFSEPAWSRGNHKGRNDVGGGDNDVGEADTNFFLSMRYTMRDAVVREPCVNVKK